ncbi:MAG: assimilatory nitrate reductase catalytic subunit [Halioglobus sp.]|jgi:assimilatory nitrate reductase catalytic subunit
MSQCHTTCPYCGVGCGVIAQVQGNTVSAITGDPSHPANAGRLCVKGAALAETFDPEGRMLYPRLEGERLSWATALDTVSTKLRETRDKYGPGSIAFYLSGQLLTEDYYVANKLMKGFLGSANVDTNSRLCMSSAVAAYKRAFGEDYVPCTYEDLELCDLLLMVGSNAAWTHPVVYQRIVAAKAENPDKKVVVVDTRRTATCDIADLHLQIKPGSDAFLFSGLLKYLAHNEKLDHHYLERCTNGLEPALAAIEGLSEEEVLNATGLALEDLHQFYLWFAQTEKSVTLYSQGVNQSATGTDKCNAIINVHLATARLGKPGAGPFSITGQPNAMGGREVGGLANQLAAHMDFNPAHIDKVQRFWGATDMATEPGLKAIDLFESMDRGDIKFIWIMATNPAVSLPDTKRVRAALQRCEFVVVSDCAADTDTVQLANLVLPAAGWGEKDGTVTNSERTISRQRRLVNAPGEAKPDWWMVTEVARRLGFGAHFNYHSPVDIFREHAALSGFENAGERAFDIGPLQLLGDEEYEQLAPVRWPIRPREAAKPIEDGVFYTDSGRGQLVPIVPELPKRANGQSDSELLINTGRVRDQWHTMTRTGSVPRLARHYDFFAAGLSAEEASRLNLVEGQLVEVSNALGTIRCCIRIEEGSPPGQLYLPIHWSDQFTGNGVVCSLIPALVDAVSGQPQLKYAAAEIKALPVATWGLLFTRREPARYGLDYWSKIAVKGGFLTLLADVEDASKLANRMTAILPTECETVSFDDAARNDMRILGTIDNKLEYALFLGPDRESLPVQNWISDIASYPLDAMALLSGASSGVQDTGAMVCSCWEVGEKQITSAIEQGATSVDELGARLRCGTQCGSCVPELKRLLVALPKAYVAIRSKTV